MNVWEEWMLCVSDPLGCPLSSHGLQTSLHKTPGWAEPGSEDAWGWVWVGKVVDAEGWRRPVSSTLRPWQPDPSNMNRIKCEHFARVWECYFPISLLSRPSIGSLDPNSLSLRNTIHVPSVCQWTRLRENAHSMDYNMSRKYEFQFVSDLNNLCFYLVFIFLFKIQWFELKIFFFCFGCLTQMPWEGQKLFKSQDTSMVGIWYASLSFCRSSFPF